MSKKKIILIIGLIILIAISSLIGMSKMFSPYERQVGLGYKLLRQGNYEEAILAFDKAIEIDVRRDKAYIGKADVFVKRNDDNALEDIKSVIKTAYDYHYNDDNVVNAIIRISDDLRAAGHEEIAIELLNFGYELTNDERIREHAHKLLDDFSASLLAELYALFEAGDEEGVKRKLQDEEYPYFTKNRVENEYKYIYFPNSNAEQTGHGIALYHIDSEEYRNLFVYYGDFEKGLRSGNGIWVGANGIEYYWFEGQWHDDKPNGEGTLLEVKDESKIQKEPNHTYPLRIETSGSFKNGLYHGSINEIWYMDIGDKMVWTPITAIDGVFQEMNPIPSDIASRDYAKEQYAEGNYIVSISNGGADLWWDQSPNFIVGFKD